MSHRRRRRRCYWVVKVNKITNVKTRRGHSDWTGWWWSGHGRVPEVHEGGWFAGVDVVAYDQGCRGGSPQHTSPHQAAVEGVGCWQRIRRKSTGVGMKADWLFCRAWGLICVSQRTVWGSVGLRRRVSMSRVSTWEIAVAACAYDNAHRHTRIEFHFPKKSVYFHLKCHPSVQFSSSLLARQGNSLLQPATRVQASISKKYPKNVFVTMAEEGCIR